MSIFRGSDLVPANYPDREAFQADHAPVRYFHRELLVQPSYYGRDIAYDNQAVGGSFDNDVPGQFVRSVQEPKGLYFLGLGMNSGSLYGVYSRGPNAGYTIGILRSHVRATKAAGLTPFLCNTIHPWPERVTIAEMTDSLYEGLNWPVDRRTLRAERDFVFDAATGTLALPGFYADGLALFDHPSGGTRIKSGSRLRVGGAVAAGPNDGRTMTVVERIDGTSVRVRSGDIQESATYRTIVQHVEPPLDEIMDTPPSKQRQSRDWTGNGVPVEGLASYALWNDMLRDLCRDEDIPLLDIEYRGFRWVERYGWPSVYTATYDGVTMTNFNHPVLAAQRVIYGDLMIWLAREYGAGRLPGGFSVLRGPTIG